MIVKPHSGRCRNVGSGLRRSTSGCPAGVRGLSSQTILPHTRPLHSKTSTATLFANSQVPSGTSAEARRLWIASISSPAHVRRNGNCAIDRNQEISSSFAKPLHLHRERGGS